MKLKKLPILKTLTAILLLGLLYWGYSSRSLQPTSPALEYFSDPQVAELALATAKGDIKAMDELVANGADVNFRGKENMTPLFWSFVMYKDPHRERESYKRGFKHLLELGADPLIAENQKNWTMLAVASRYEDSDYLKILVDRDVDVNFVHNSYHYPTAMHQAISSNRFKNLKLLVEGGGCKFHKP